MRVVEKVAAEPEPDVELPMPQAAQAEESDSETDEDVDVACEYTDAPSLNDEDDAGEDDMCIRYTAATGRVSLLVNDRVVIEKCTGFSFVTTTGVLTDCTGIDSTVPFESISVVKRAMFLVCGGKRKKEKRIHWTVTKF